MSVGERGWRNKLSDIADGFVKWWIKLNTELSNDALISFLAIDIQKN